MKNIFNLVFTILIIYFSFYYTNMVSNYIKNKDPIMIEIKSNINKYYKKPLNAIVLDNKIIPGVSGVEIDINKSYTKMKKTKSYQESLLVFNEIKPTTSLNNNKDKLIIRGNRLNKKVSILLKINDINILNKFINNDYFKDLNYIFSNNFINNNYNYLNQIDNNIIINQDSISNSNINIIDYCYTNNKEETNKCLSYNKLSILPTSINHDYYYNTYQTITNGSILSYQVLNENNIGEIKLLINGIRNLGYEIVSLDSLLKE